MQAHPAKAVALCIHAQLPDLGSMASVDRAFGLRSSAVSGAPEQLAPQLHTPLRPRSGNAMDPHRLDENPETLWDSRRRLPTVRRAPTGLLARFFTTRLRATPTDYGTAHGHFTGTPNSGKKTRS